MLSFLSRAHDKAAVLLKAVPGVSGLVVLESNTSTTVALMSWVVQICQSPILTPTQLLLISVVCDTGRFAWPIAEQGRGITSEDSQLLSGSPS